MRPVTPASMTARRSPRPRCGGNGSPRRRSRLASTAGRAAASARFGKRRGRSSKPSPSWIIRRITACTGAAAGDAMICSRVSPCSDSTSSGSMQRPCRACVGTLRRDLRRHRRRPLNEGPRGRARPTAGRRRPPTRRHFPAHKPARPPACRSSAPPRSRGHRSEPAVRGDRVLRLDHAGQRFGDFMAAVGPLPPPRATIAAGSVPAAAPTPPRAPAPVHG